MPQCPWRRISPSPSFCSPHARGCSAKCPRSTNDTCDACTTARGRSVSHGPNDMPLDQFQRSLPREDPRSSAFLLAVRRASGGASYAPYVAGHTPWHSAMAATYAQATAPLRRLQDRYVIEAALAVAVSRPVPDDIASAFERLPKAMALADQRAAKAEREAIALTEAVVLSECVGQTFSGVVDRRDRVRGRGATRPPRRPRPHQGQECRPR